MLPERSDPKAVGAAPGDAAAERLPVVDLVRCLSILLVMAYHFCASRTDLPFPRAWRALARNGPYGVNLFFVISGFLITRTLLRRSPDLSRINLRDFYSRRAGRILPLFLLTVALGAAGLALYPPGPPGTDRRGAVCLHAPAGVIDGWFWLSLFTFTFNWLRIVRHSAYGMHWDVMWSLSVEEQFYLTYPLLLRRLATRQRAAVALFGVALLGPLVRGAAYLIAPGDFLASFINSFGAFDQLALGALLSFGLEHLERAPLNVRPWLEILLGLAGAVGLLCTFATTALMNPVDRIYTPCVLGLSLCAFMGVGVRRRWFSSWPFRLPVAIGQLSYGGYLLHAAVLFSLWKVLGRTPLYRAFGGYAVATFLLAAVSFRLFERPASRTVRRLARERF